MRRRSLRAAAAASALFLVSTPSLGLEGRVVDARSGTPLAGAIVTAGGTAVATDAMGVFRIEAGDAQVLRARAVGHGRIDLPLALGADPVLEIPLEPLHAKALYLSLYGVADPGLRGGALDLVAKSVLDAVVIDVKSDRGQIAWPVETPLAAGLGNVRQASGRAIDALLARARTEGLYTIARVVVFKDEPLAAAHPEIAVHTAGGALFRDRESLAWVDPYRTEAWDYSIAVAVAAAKHGFDEVQFDYARLPDARGVRFAGPNTRAERTAVVEGFLREARRRLVPYNVFLAADVFGYVCWNRDDTQIGQELLGALAAVDYLSPMLYPSGFQFGIPGLRRPLDNVFAIVRRTLDEAQQRAGAPPERFRPWLQAFPDYAFDRRHFGPPEVRAQIRAAEEFGASGWMLWNPHNVYRDTGLGP